MKTAQRFGALAAIALSLTTAVGSAATAAGTTQISGTAVLDVDATVCTGPPAGYSDFDEFTPLLLSGSLAGCWYTNIDTSKVTPSGVYLESGREVFVGTVNGGPTGTFATTYKFESKFAPDGAQLHGRCQHPLVSGSGTGPFAGATGRVDFKDIVEEGTLVYRGHIKLPGR